VHTFLEDNINGAGYYIATASSVIIASMSAGNIDPFCRIGDLTSPVKSYFNIHKLLKYAGIEYSKVGTKDLSLWDKRLEPSAFEKEFTQQWLQMVKDKLRTTITTKRQVPAEVVEQFGSKVIHPKKAL
jgi:ClpP class serine protease